MGTFKRYDTDHHFADAFAYTMAATTNARDPRDLNVLSEEDYNRLVKEAADKADREALAAMTPTQKVNAQLETVAQRYGPLKPWAT